MNNDQKRTILAFTLSGIILFGWNAYFAPKNDPAVANQVLLDNKLPVKPQDNNVAQVVQANNTTTDVAPTTSLNEVSEIELVKDNNKFLLNSDFSFKNAHGFNTHYSLKELSDKDSFLKVYLIGANNSLIPLNFAFEEMASSSSLVGYDQANEVKLTLNLLQNGKLNYLLESKNPSRLAFHFDSIKKTNDNNTPREYLVYSNDIHRYAVGSDELGDGKTKWFGLDSNHHFFTSVFNKKTVTRYNATEDGVLVVSLVEPSNVHEGYFLYSLKNYDYLKSFDDQLDLAVNFGLFSVLAVPILKGLNFIFNYVGNYGIAIIILTFLIRFLTFPLQFKSFKSMKKMQTVQPEIAKLKERYKDDPAKMQRETMALFKKAGANPLGGCLPMLMQVPIFIAFYQAINNSVDLVGSPFYGWIMDLSTKDPYYVLPVLMGITMLLQTKLNPSTTADPNQQKIMYIMPLVFCFIMKDLPAGLNLYFCISNILGIGQQLLVYKVVD